MERTNNDTKTVGRKLERCKMSKSEGSNLLKEVERRRLEKLEKVVSVGVESFLATGSALKEIRDQRLYREEFKSFDAYIKTRWGFDRSRAYQLIDASEIKAELSTIVDKAPKAEELKTEGQLRELASVPSESLAEVVQKAAEIAGNAPLTAKVLKEAREQVLEAEELDDREASAPKSTAVEAGPLQCVAWFKEQIRLVNELKRNLDRVEESPGYELINSKRRSMLLEIEHIKGGFIAAMPHAICPRCYGEGEEGCAQCGNMGWVNKPRFDELGGE